MPSIDDAMRVKMLLRQNEELRGRLMDAITQAERAEGYKNLFKLAQEALGRVRAYYQRLHGSGEEFPIWSEFVTKAANDGTGKKIAENKLILPSEN